MPLSGAWLQQARAPDPNEAATHEVGDEHDRYGSVDYNVQWQAPPYQDVAPAPETVGMEWVTDYPGIVLREPPSLDHGYAPSHGVDDGSIDGRNRSDVKFQHSDESYRTDAFDGLSGDVSGVSDAALRRGKNAEPLSNPPLSAYGGQGFRFGRYAHWNLWRKMAPPWRRHDERIVTPWTVTPIGDAPPPVNAGTRNSPFSSLARAIRNVNARPALRRIPEPIDEAIMSDGSESADVYLPSWVT